MLPTKKSLPAQAIGGQIKNFLDLTPEKEDLLISGGTRNPSLKALQSFKWLLGKTDHQDKLTFPSSIINVSSL